MGNFPLKTARILRIILAGWGELVSGLLATIFTAVGLFAAPDMSQKLGLLFLAIVSGFIALWLMASKIVKLEDKLSSAPLDIIPLPEDIFCREMLAGTGITSSRIRIAIVNRGIRTVEDIKIHVVQMDLNPSKMDLAACRT